MGDGNMCFVDEIKKISCQMTFFKETLVVMVVPLSVLVNIF